MNWGKAILITAGAGLLTLIVTAFATCALHRSQLRFMGHWEGGFRVVSVGGSTDPVKCRDYSTDGVLQLYGYGGKSFKLEVHNLTQGMDLGGSWKIDGNVATLRFKQFTFPGPSIDVLEAQGKPFVEPAVLKKWFQEPVRLQLDKNLQHLTGLTTRFGDIVGHYEFTRNDR